MALALAILVIVSACGNPARHRGSPAEARAIVVAYLQAVAGDEEDRGWSILLPASRRAYDSRDQYIQLATEAAWDAFTWRLTEADSSYCEDGGLYCQVRLQIDGVPPDFLLEAPNAAPTDRLQTITIDPAAGASGNAWMVVYFDLEGSRGISTGGG